MKATFTRYYVRRIPMYAVRLDGELLGYIKRLSRRCFIAMVNQEVGGLTEVGRAKTRNEAVRRLPGAA